MEIFFPIIGSKHLNFSMELGMNHGLEVSKNGSSLRFFFHEKCPSDLCVIINEGDKPPSSGYVLSPVRSPYVALNN